MVFRNFVEKPFYHFEVNLTYSLQNTVRLHSKTLQNFKISRFKGAFEKRLEQNITIDNQKAACVEYMCQKLCLCTRIRQSLSDELSSQK